MPGKQTRIIGQRIHLFANALLKSIEASAGEISATNRTCKDKVTTKTHARRWNIQDAVTRRVPGRETNFEFDVAKLRTLSDDHQG